MKTGELLDRMPGATLTDFVAELTAVAYDIALRYAAGNAWHDLQLDLWHALTDAAGKWDLKPARSAAW